MDLDDALAQTKSAMLRAEAEGFDNTAAALRQLAVEIEKARKSGSKLSSQPSEFGLSGESFRWHKYS